MTTAAHQGPGCGSQAAKDYQQGMATLVLATWGHLRQASLSMEIGFWTCGER